MYSPDVVAANACEDNTISLPNSLSNSEEACSPLPKVVNYSKSLDFVSDHAEKDESSYACKAEEDRRDAENVVKASKEKMLTEDSGVDAETSTDARRPNRSGSFGKSDNESHTPSKREIEPLLQPDENRFVMFPIRHNDVWDLYKKSIDSFWKAEDIDLSKDPTDWKKLTPDVQNFIKMVLAFFAASDGVIVENLALRFMSDVQAPEIRAFYAFQNFMEGIHSEVYSLLIDTYVEDPEEKNKLFHAVEHYPCIKKKSDWARKWISDGRSSFATRLLAFAIVEGIYFSSSFAAIFWLKRMNVLPGLCLANEYISRDESMHVDHAVLLYKKLKRKVPKKRFVEIMKEAVEIEIDFITVSIPCRMIGMNHDLMIQYIKFVTDRLCLQMGYDKIYNATNPFDFMEFISLDCRTNFFERRVSAYSMANKTMDDTTFDMDTDF